MKNITQQVKLNWKSGLSVALVSIPLSLSLSIASGAGPLPGIITAIWAGFVASLIGGSQFNIVGPAGALSTILAGYALQFHTAGILPVLAIVAGFFTLVAWLFRWDRYLVFIPSSVIHGFTLGVAITIAAGQLPSLFGEKGLPHHPQLYLNIFESFKGLGYAASPIAFGIFALGLFLMFAIYRISAKLPNAIFVAGLGIIIGMLQLHNVFSFHLTTLQDIYGSLSLHLINPVSLNPNLLNLSVIQAGAVVAFITVLETLISAKVADGMTKTKFRRRREVLGVGLANIASGFAGGLPGSGVFARTALNVKTGATSSYSQLINSIAVAVISIIFIPWFSYIPMVIIASILIYACVRMIGIEHFSRLWRFDKTSFLIALFTAALMVFYDATTGIIIGMLVALIINAYRLSRAQAAITSHDEEGSVNIAHIDDDEVIRGTTIVYRFAGELTYINGTSHIEALNRFENDIKTIILNVKNLFYIDVDGMEALDEIVENAHSKGQTILITGSNQSIFPLLETRNWFRELENKKLTFQSSDEAVIQSFKPQNV